jgi:hypothetical protein
MSTEKYPLDFDALKKGDSISPHKLMEIVRANVGTPKYQFRVMNLERRIRREMACRGRPVNVAIVDGHLRILTDEESVPYMIRRWGVGERIMRRTLENEAIIDTGNLTEETRQRHERNIQVHGFKLAAIRAAARKLKKPSPPQIGDK